MRDDCEYENTPVDTLDEARHCPYSEAEVAAAVITTFPETRNLTYEVIEVGEPAKSAKAGE